MTSQNELSEITNDTKNTFQNLITDEHLVHAPHLTKDKKQLSKRDIFKQRL